MGSAMRLKSTEPIIPLMRSHDRLILLLVFGLLFEAITSISHMFPDIIRMCHS